MSMVRGTRQRAGIMLSTARPALRLIERARVRPVRLDK